MNPAEIRTPSAAAINNILSRLPARSSFPARIRSIRVWVLADGESEGELPEISAEALTDAIG